MDLLEISKNNRKKQAPFYIKVLSLFSVVRGYNILLIVIAQYLASIFIFSPQKSLKYVLLDLDLYFIVLATTCVIASGYIINNFYDLDADRINRPIKHKIDTIVPQKIKLIIYFLLNFIGFLFAFLVSWRAALFFSVYIFLIWFYSHKLKKYPLIGLFSAVILAILPFLRFLYTIKTFLKLFSHMQRSYFLFY
jgi:4-hydroxybenzoate polyprenyltransferase